MNPTPAPTLSPTLPTFIPSRSPLPRNQTYEPTPYPSDNPTSSPTRNITHIGCYEVVTSCSDCLLQYGPKEYGYDLITCSDACVTYTYFGLQDGGQCFCGPTLATVQIFGDFSTQCPDSQLGAAGYMDVFEHKPDFCTGVKRHINGSIIVECTGGLNMTGDHLIDFIPIVPHYTIEFDIIIESMEVGVSQVLVIGESESMGRDWYPAIQTYWNGNSGVFVLYLTVNPWTGQAIVYPVWSISWSSWLSSFTFWMEIDKTSAYWTMSASQRGNVYPADDTEMVGPVTFGEASSKGIYIPSDKERTGVYYLSNLKITLFDATPAPTSTAPVNECQDIYGGNWILVRHSYDGWHNATDDLNGTDVYGIYDNDPKSVNMWSIPFNKAVYHDGSAIFMFSNGDCSEYLVTRRDQFSTPKGIYNGYIIESHYDEDYYAEWLYRGFTVFPEDPYISWLDRTSLNSESILYVGDGKPHTGHNRFDVYNADKSVNVWLR